MHSAIGRPQCLLISWLGSVPRRSGAKRHDIARPWPPGQATRYPSPHAPSPRGKRPVLVLSNSEFNRVGRALVAAITQGGNVDRVRGWAVSLMGTGTETQGAVVLSQCRMIDYIERGARHVESVPSYVIEEALAKLQAALDPE